MKYQGNELYHYGILGQKWGQRRYQNEDGTYTEEGKRRRRSDNYSDDYKNYKKLSKKSVKEMSNKELNEYNNRVNLEANYKKLKFSKSIIGKGVVFVSSLAGIIIVGNNFYDAASKGKTIISKLAN